MLANALGTLLVPAALLSQGLDWSGFRGNNGCGTAAGAKPPEVLDLERNAQWRTEVPPGYSSPVLGKHDVFLTGAEGNQLVTLCVDRHSGEIRWRREIEFDGKRPGANSPAAPSPATDGERVVVLFHHVGLVAYDLKGEELWRKPLGPFHIPHGMAASPLLHDGLVVQLVDQNVGSFLAAFDAQSGEERWRVARPGAAHGYSTPAIHAPAEGPAEVIVPGSYQVTAYALADGKKLWWLDGAAWQTKAVPVLQGGLCIVNAFMPPSSEFGLQRVSQTWKEALAERDADKDGKLSRSEWVDEMLHQLWFIFDRDGDTFIDEGDYDYIASSASATGGLFAIRLGGQGSLGDEQLAWKLTDRRLLPDAPSPLLFEGLLWMVRDGGVLVCVDPATGEVVKQGRVGAGGPYFASPVGADGRIYLASRAGEIAVVRATRDWEVLAVKPLGEEVWSTPALSGDQAFVRTQAALYCFQES